MSGMMRCHTDALDRRISGCSAMLGYWSMTCVQDIADCLLADRRQERARVIEGFHRFIAGASRSQEHDGGGEVFLAEGCDQVNRMYRGRHAASFPSR